MFMCIHVFDGACRKARDKVDLPCPRVSRSTTTWLKELAMFHTTNSIYVFVLFEQNNWRGRYSLVRMSCLGLRKDCLRAETWRLVYVKMVDLLIWTCTRRLRDMIGCNCEDDVTDGRRCLRLSRAFVHVNVYNGVFVVSIIALPYSPLSAYAVDWLLSSVAFTADPDTYVMTRWVCEHLEAQE